MHLIYLDTCVISQSLREPELHHGISRLVQRRAGRLVISETHLAELSAADRQFNGVLELCSEHGFWLLRNGKHFVDEAVSSYPSIPQGSPLLQDRPIRSDELATLLVDPLVRQSRAHMASSAQAIPERFRATMHNFPPRGGTYAVSQADEFAARMLLQWLDDSNPSFSASVRSRGHLETAPFASVLLHSYLVYWRYYLGKRQPEGTASILGDHAHARFYPYCHAVVVENDICGSLRQLKQSRTHAAKLLRDIDILNMKDVRQMAESESNAS